jgi:hypothetical protein
MKKYKPLIAGSMAFTGLLILYFTILVWANSPEHAVDQFFEMWYWILILSVGFGMQVGLYFHIKNQLHEKMLESRAELVATGGASTASMVACCAHHIVDVLPIFGLSAAASFLFKYQLSFILIGVFSNMFGIISMLIIMQRNNLHLDRLHKLYRYDITKVRKMVLYFSLIIILFTFIQ